MNTDFYNTIHLTGNAISSARKKGENQRITILNYFIANPLSKLSNPEIHVLTGIEKTGAPLTSTRRAVHDLLDNGDIINTFDTKPGLFGKPNFIFRLNTTKHPVKYTQLTIQ